MQPSLNVLYCILQQDKLFDKRDAMNFRCRRQRCNKPSNYCSNFKYYFSKSQNIFVQITQFICIDLRNLRWRWQRCSQVYQTSNINWPQMQTQLLWSKLVHKPVVKILWPNPMWYDCSRGEIKDTNTDKSYKYRYKSNVIWLLLRRDCSSAEMRPTTPAAGNTHGCNFFDLFF